MAYKFNPISGNLDLTVNPATAPDVAAGTSSELYVSPATLAGALTGKATFQNFSVNTATFPVFTTSGFRETVYVIRNLASSVSFTNANITSSNVDGDRLLVRIKDNGAGTQNITWDTEFVNMGVAMPTNTLVTGKNVTVGFIYDATLSKWGCVAVVYEP